MRTVSAMVMAAGMSTRMGGPNKLLLPWRNSTIIGTTVATLLSCIEDVLVITGRDAEQIAAATTPARTVFNEHYQQGLGSSIATGVKACLQSDGFLIVLGDMPQLSPTVLQTLVETFQRAPQDAIIAPIYANEPNRTGHPVLFGSSYREALAQLEGDEGARSIIQQNRHNLITVQVENSLPDIDSPADLSAASSDA